MEYIHKRVCQRTKDCFVTKQHNWRTDVFAANCDCNSI